MFRKKEDNKGKFAIGALFAAIAGYATGILTAPKSGKRSRRTIGRKATKAKVQGERELKKLHSEIGDLIDEASKKTKLGKTKANKEMSDAVDKSKDAKNKARDILSALHDGDADDPELQKAITQVKRAKANLAKFLKK